MIRKIVTFGDPVLRARCAPVSEITPEIRELVVDMLETMVEAEGVGLAAPQVGVPLQLGVIDVSHDPECVTYLRINGEDTSLDACMPLVFVNPRLAFGSAKVTDTEGCLSFPDVRADITRPEEITATLVTLEGRTLVIETDGLLARALQHETDHLNGVLFIDRMSSAAKTSLRGKLKRLQQQHDRR